MVAAAAPSGYGPDGLLEARGAGQTNASSAPIANRMERSLVKRPNSQVVALVLT